MISKPDVLPMKTLQITTIDDLRHPGWASLPSPVFSLVAALLLLLILITSGCCSQPSVTPVWQKPQIPPSLLVPRTRLNKFAGMTCDDLADFTFYVIKDRNNCASDLNVIQKMIK